MAQPFANLPAIIRKRKVEVFDLTNRIAREAARRGGAYLAADTAVDTGQARSNWVMTLDVPFEAVIPAISPYPKLGNAQLTAARKSETTNLSAVEAQHSSAANAFDVRRNRVLILRNNVDHIGDIESGSSPQTPAGLLHRGLEAATASIAGKWRLAESRLRV